MALEGGLSGRAVSEWSDEELLAVLASRGGTQVPVTPTTRPMLERRIERELFSTSSDAESSMGKNREGKNGSSPQRESISPALPAKGKENEAGFEGYYGVVASSEGAAGNLQLSPFYTSRSDAIKAIQNIPGARFKKFKNQASAEAFSNSPGRSGGRSSGAEKGAVRDAVQRAPEVHVGDKPNQFPSLKTQDLTKFRKLIESGDETGFSQAVWSNPRYLINCYGDAPEILQPGCRYNALHCAVRARRLEICKELVAILQSHHFWDVVYPNDSHDTVLDRKKHLIDLYLNMQDKIGGETPLHFACKLGYEEIVSFLLSFPSIDTSIKNKSGKTAAEIVCANAASSSCTVKDRITDLINAPPVYYVPVFRAVDNCTPPQLTPPCTMEEYRQQESVLSDEMGTPIIGQAFAGPMSPAQADDFYREWRSPSHSRERKEAHRIKRSDANRGFERVGRQLAQQRDVGWLEYWDFLGCYCNLRKPEGLDKLEHYLANFSSPSSWKSPKLVRQVAVTSKGYTPHSGSKKGRNSNGDVSRELFPKDGGGGKEEGEGEEEDEEEEEFEVEEEGEQGEGEGEKEREGGGGYSLEPPVTDLDSVIESMAGMTLGNGRGAGGNGVMVEEGKEGRREVEKEKEGEGEEMEVEEEGREQTGGNGGREEEDGDHSTGHSTEVDPSTDHQHNDIPCNEGLDLHAVQGHNDSIPQERWLPEDGEKEESSGGEGPVTPPRPGTADKKMLGFLLGPEPTKLDRDVVLAVGEIPNLSSSQYPHTARWLERVKTFSEQEQRSWRTPLSSWEKRCQREGGETPIRRLSPLVVSSPPLSPLHRPPTIPTSSSSLSSPHRLLPNALSPRRTFSPLQRSQNTSTPSRLQHTARSTHDQVLQNIADISYPV